MHIHLNMNPTPLLKWRIPLLWKTRVTRVSIGKAFGIPILRSVSPLASLQVEKLLIRYHPGLPTQSFLREEDQMTAFKAELGLDDSSVIS
jgi:hypothetical protein